MSTSCREANIAKFKKTKIQEKAIELLVDKKFNEYLLYGGSRSGKTAILIYAIIVRALKTKSRHLIIRRFFSDIKKSIWLDTLPKILSLITDDRKIATLNNSDFYYKFENGSEIFLGGLDDKERAEKILGNEYSTIYFNEASQLSLNSIDVAKTRLAEKSNLRNVIFLDMNPPKKKHWTYNKFILDKNPTDNLKIENIRHASMLMNPKDNLENLDESYMEILDSLPDSQRKRFRDGEFGDDDIGEVFNTANIRRIDKLPADVDRIIIAHDPAVTSKITSDEHGILICARKGDFGYVIKDMSGIYTPDQAARRVVAGYHEYECGRVICEVNQGGDYLEEILRSIDQNVSYKAVRAMKGKVKRAEPVGALYEQKRIFHVGHFPELENEMGDFKTNEKEMEYSPNRCDALVWAFASLFNLSQGEPRIRSL